MSGSEAPPSHDVERLIEGNPNVDRSQFAEATQALESLREQGINPPGYGIDSPYQRQPSSRQPSSRRAGDTIRK
jgi:hypothetical protein